MARRRLTTLLAATFAAGLLALPASAQSLEDVTETTDTVTETVEDTVDEAEETLTGDDDGSDDGSGDGDDETTANVGVDAEIDDDGASATATVGDEEVTVDTDDVTELLPDEEAPVPPPGDDEDPGDDGDDNNNNKGTDTQAAGDGDVVGADQPADDGAASSGGTATTPPAVRVDRGYSPNPSTPLVSDHTFDHSLGQSDEVDEEILPQVAGEAPEDEAILATQTPTGDGGTDGALMRIVAALMVAATAGLWQRQYRATVS